MLQLGLDSPQAICFAKAKLQGGVVFYSRL
jgi:hypothetical protein